MQKKQKAQQRLVEVTKKRLKYLLHIRCGRSMISIIRRSTANRVPTDLWVGSVSKMHTVFSSGTKASFALALELLQTSSIYSTQLYSHFQPLDIIQLHLSHLHLLSSAPWENSMNWFNKQVKQMRRLVSIVL